MSVPPVTTGTAIQQELPVATADPAAAILSPLNDEQRRAVTHGEGPLLVVAGAGTGKTQVITRRIAWLIATKRARPEEILALTFTDKAAAEMEARVDELVPYGYIGATLSTFHAFGDRLVREHAVELGLTSKLRVESRAEILVFLREHLFELGLERYLPLGRPDQHLEALVSVFDRARDEDVSPEDYLAFASRLAQEAKDDAERDRAAAEREKAIAYGAYQDLLMNHGRVDFGSQIGLALRVLRERPYLRREYQDQYRYVLVDEFQDTNHVQFELVKLLAGGEPGRGARGNLTAVGDDDQSIYRFRGAKIENLLGFLTAFPGAQTIVLRKNYRSGQAILDRAYRLVQHNNPERLEHRGGYDKRLLSTREDPGVVEHRAYGTASDEAEEVAAEIAAAIESGERTAGDIAVLARTHFHLEPVAGALRARGVRFHRTNTRGLYQRPEVTLCLNVLRAVADPSDGPASFQALGDPQFGVDPVDLALACSAAKHRNRPLIQVAAELAARPDGELQPESREAIRRFVDLHARLCRTAVQRPTAEVLYEFVTESGLLGRLTNGETLEAIEQVQNLNKLFRIVTRVGPLLKTDRVDQFIGHLDLLIDAGDDPAAAELDHDEDAVHLLTAHNAKGLEFPVVYMVQLAEERFPLRWRAEALPFPPELHRADADAKVDHEREERRLFYVGMTRARERLVLSHAVDYGGKSARSVSRFVVEALELTQATRLERSASALESIARHAPPAESPAAPAIAIPADQPLTLSNEQIDDFLTCPLKYHYAYVMRVPLSTDPGFMYGRAIHHAIQIYHHHRMRKLPITVDDVLSAFEQAWSSDGFFSREHEERRLEEGRQTLRRFVASEESGGRLPLAIEMEFKFRVGQDVVRGRWDRIDERPEGIVLVDYKTSEIEDAEKARERARKSLKDDQLGIYALAYLETRGKMPARVELHFVESGLSGAAEVKPEHLTRARSRVAQAAAGIRAARFIATPDPRTCSYCPYARFCVHSMAKG
jgi:DNA helicase II / ATP-dependent DNA helicase PcrA